MSSTKKKAQIKAKLILYYYIFLMKTLVEVY